MTDNLKVLHLISTTYKYCMHFFFSSRANKSVMDWEEIEEVGKSVGIMSSQDVRLISMPMTLLLSSLFI